MSSLKKQKEAAADFADAVHIAVEALRAKGFSEIQAVQLVCASISSARVYIPFAGLTLAEDPAGSMKH